MDKASNYELVELVDKERKVIATASTNDATSVTFTNIAWAPVIAKDKSATYYVRATANTDVNSTIQLNFNGAGTNNVKASNGTTVAIPTATVNWNQHVIAENSILVAKLTNSNKDLATSALRFSVTANGKDEVELTNLDVNVASNYITTGAKVVLYKNSISNANKVAESAAAWTLTLPAFSTKIDAWSTVNYILVVEWAVVWANTPDWTVRVNDITFDGFNAKNYSNLGDLPMSESK